jgi:hypothetical protein
MGPNVDPLDPQAEQRKLPQTSGNGVSAAERGSRAATGMVALWWQSRHVTSSSPGSTIRSARVGGLVMVQVPIVCATMVRRTNAMEKPLLLVAVSYDLQFS